MNLTPDQEQATDQFMQFMLSKEHSQMVLTGAAGRGKSWLTKYMLSVLQKRAKLANLIMGRQSPHINLLATATTHKAATVLSASLGIPATTIHSALGAKVVNNYHTGKTSLAKTKDYRFHHSCLIIVDEASYVDKQLLEFIDEATINCKVLYIGDQNQLVMRGETSPPVFELKDVAKATLTTPVRNQGAIEKLADIYCQAVVTGHFPRVKVDNVDVVWVDGPGFKSRVDAEFSDFHRNPSHARILAWTNDKVVRYNNYIRELNNLPPTVALGESVIINSHLKGPGLPTDYVGKVTALKGEKSEHGVSGYIVEIDRCTEVFVPYSRDQHNVLLKQLASKKDWHTYFYIKDNWGDLRPVYASTVHKSQGSTYDRVFVDLADIGACMDANTAARLLYVAISRASKQVVLYGQLPKRYGGIYV